LPPPTRGEATKGEDADAASASRLDGELEARVAAAAAVAYRSSAMARPPPPPRGVGAGVQPLFLPASSAVARGEYRGCGGDGSQLFGSPE